MRAFFVVLDSPRRDLPPRIEQVLKPAHRQALIAQSSVKTFHPRILRRFARLNVHQLDLSLHAPRQKMPASQFRSVVATDRQRLSALGHDRIQHSRDSPAGKTRIHFQRQTLPRVGITTLSTRIARPHSTASCTKSNAHSWFAAVRASSGLPSRTQCFRFFRRSSTRLPDTPDALACGSPVLHLVAATHAAADTQNAVSIVPTPPTACATAHRCASSGSGNSPPPSPSARKPGAR